MDGASVLDLFCGEGGASKGYEQAGLRLLAAVDRNAERAGNHYAHKRGVVYAMDWRDGLERFAHDADLIHASPPCQAFSTQTPKTTRHLWPNLIPEVRDALMATGKPYVIENVPSAPLIGSRMEGTLIELNGLMFGELSVDWDVRDTASDYEQKILANSHPVDGGGREWNTCRNGQWKYVVPNPPTQWRIHRPRLFELGGFRMVSPPEKLSSREVMSVTTSSNPTMVWNKINRQQVPLSVRQAVMGGLDWMTAVGVGEAIPPSYAREVGRQFLINLPPLPTLW